MSEQSKHPTETAEYWDEMARNEESFAKNPARTESVESTLIHRRNAVEYRANAARIRSAMPDEKKPTGEAGSERYGLSMEQVIDREAIEGYDRIADIRMFSRCEDLVRLANQSARVAAENARLREAITHAVGFIRQDSDDHRFACTALRSALAGGKA